ncbi:hypothetical protein [Microcoleus sp. herbarium14]|uniref:hypothetical protein n=1 Tax=Microcoleus sp. herbarium14 TaxID=3055439 RepID=UPI002FCFD854
MTILTKSTAYDKLLADAIGKLIDLDAIAERLLATDCQQCSLFTHKQVKFALLKWIEHNLESLEECPEWFVANEPKHFYRHLPFDELQDATELREYDYEEMYEAMASEGDPDNASSLEDDFKGTPEEAAIAAIYW